MGIKNAVYRLRLQDRSRMMLVWKYIKQIWKVMLFYLFNGCTLAMVCWLYQECFEMLLYTEVLVGSVGLLCMTISFFRYVKEHKQRERAKEDLLLLLEEIPAGKTCAEQEYKELLEQLHFEYQSYRSKQIQGAKERQEYYTTWVHQIKTPIAAMKLQLQEEDTESNRQLADQLFRIEQYVDMALSYARLGDEVSDFLFEETPLDELLRSIIRKYASQFIRKRLRMQYEGTELTILTDSKWLSLMLEQIISNAVKYTKEGSVSIQVSQEGVLTIRDTGIGIAKEDIPRIFEKGFTGYNGRSGEKSTGIGLYLAKETARKLNCKLEVESEIGKGTSIIVRLPMKKWKME